MENYKMYVNGEWVPPKSKKYFKTINPYTLEEWAEIPYATKEDVEYAIDSAREAFDTHWSKTSGKKRSELMFKFADLIEENAESLAEIETRDNGKLYSETTKQLMFTARAYRYFGGFADKIAGEVLPLDNNDTFDFTLREPIGVAVLITSWNSPMQLLSNKLAPAIAAGNCVVIKPSEHASASTLELMKLVDEAGFPKGVINVVTGFGDVGEHLTSSNKINKVSFTGGQQAAKSIGKSTAENFIPLTLELGGKSPNIIFSDADIDRAVNGAMAGIFASSGQTCIAGSRLFVQEEVYDEVCNKLKEKADEIVLGDPMDKDTNMGPIANEFQYKSIINALDVSTDEGAELLVGGRTNSEDKNLFIEPTILVNVTNSMKVAQNEVFGPILSIIKFSTEEEVVKQANESDYGLASGIWTESMDRILRISKILDVGTVWVNTYRSTAVQAPFGGVKKSGYGRERGLHALAEYTRIKNVMIDYSGETRDPFSIKV